MTEKEIKAADLILKYTEIDGTSTDTILRFAKQHDITEENLLVASASLVNQGFISKQRIANWMRYKLEYSGIEFKRTKKSYGEFLKDIQEKETKQAEKEERDEKTKDAQLEKLLSELTVLKDMQKEQRMFWQSGIERDKRHKWQFWITILFVIGTFILGVLNLWKALLLP